MSKTQSRIDAVERATRPTSPTSPVVLLDAPATWSQADVDKRNAKLARSGLLIRLYIPNASTGGKSVE